MHHHAQVISVVHLFRNSDVDIVLKPLHLTRAITNRVKKSFLDALHGGRPGFPRNYYVIVWKGDEKPIGLRVKDHIIGEVTKTSLRGKNGQIIGRYIPIANYRHQHIAFAII
jgi:hypothetical protein